MRYVSSIPVVTVSPNTRQVTALSAIQAVKTVHAPLMPLTNIELNLEHRSVMIPVVEQQQHRDNPVRDNPVKDRRKFCRRVKHQAVLVELRSGIDRRRHNLRDGDVVEHIDEIV